MVKNHYIPERGDIVWVVLDPVKGHEQAGRRPALVLSPRIFAEHTSLVIACPITSRAKGLPAEVALRGCQTKGAVLPIHIKSLDWQSRHLEFIEKAPTYVINQVAQAVSLFIGL